MAFEVARVHSLICSSIKDDCDYKNGKHQSPSRECITEQAQGYVHLLKDLPCDSNVLNQWSEASPLEASSCSTTEAGSDEDDDLFAGLAQQIAHSMLDDEKNGTESGALGGSTCLEPQGFMDVLEVDKVSVISAFVSPSFPCSMFRCQNYLYGQSNQSLIILL